MTTLLSTAEVAADLKVHEAVCAERYGGIIFRIGRLEKIIIGSAAVLMIGMASTIAAILLKLSGLE